MPDIEIGSSDCARQDPPRDVNVTGSASETYWFASSRWGVLNELTAKATNDAWRQVGLTPPTCQSPCRPFALLSDFSHSVDVTDWTRWWSGLWAAHYGMRVDVHIRCKVTTGCSSF